MLQPKNEWQYEDKEGLIYPWLPKPLLDQIETWKPCKLLEIGAGWSTIWWNHRGYDVTTIESDQSFIDSIKSLLLGLGTIWLADTEENYRKAITKREGKGKTVYDLVVFDGAFREETILDAWGMVKKGGKMIVDNWQQPEVSIYPESIVSQLPEPTIYKEPTHPNWQAAVFVK